MLLLMVEMQGKEEGKERGDDEVEEGEMGKCHLRIFFGEGFDVFIMVVFGKSGVGVELFTESIMRGATFSISILITGIYRIRSRTWIFCFISIRCCLFSLSVWNLLTLLSLSLPPIFADLKDTPNRIVLLVPNLHDPTLEGKTEKCKRWIQVRAANESGQSRAG